MTFCLFCFVVDFGTFHSASAAAIAASPMSASSSAIPSVVPRAEPAQPGLFCFFFSLFFFFLKRLFRDDSWSSCASASR